MSDQEQNNEKRPFHEEGGAFVLDKPKRQEEIARETRETEQHEFARTQTRMNTRLALFTGLLVIGTFVGSAISIWQTTISQRASRTARDALHVSERAYIVVGAPILDSTQKTISVPIENVGHIPSGQVNMLSHEAVFFQGDPALIKPHSRTPIQVTEARWSIGQFAGIAPPVPMQIVIPVRTLNLSKYTTGYQGILIAGTIDYNDGFKDTPIQTQLFCFQSQFNLLIKKQIVVPCDAISKLPRLESWDGFPHAETQQKN